LSATFRDLGVPAEIVDSLTARGIAEPFPIQAATLPDGLAGRDVCGRAPTGSGKTLAFGIAIAARKEVAEPNRPWGLVLVPTRELAAQVTDELRQLLAPFRATAVSVYGGTGYEGQRRALRKGVDVVVACPGRLEDLLANGDLTLGAVTVAVLDEADRMADMGFVPCVRRILDQTSAERQTLLFSATLDGDVDKIVREYMHDPVRHDVVGLEEPGDVSHAFWKVAHVDRVKVTASIIKERGRSIVFSRTKHGADRIAKQLGQLGITAVAMHGDRSQAQRDRALAAFHDGRAIALVATDVAARGIHVEAVNCVVHFDPPADHKDYVHRSGRTGRAGATGFVVTLVIPEKQKDVLALGRALKMPIDLEGAGVSLAQPVATPAEVAPPAAPKGPARPKLGKKVTTLARDRERVTRFQSRVTEAATERGPKGRPDAGGVPTGTVKFYDPKKGFGFIVLESSAGRGSDLRSRDIFVHVSAVQASGLRQLEPGQRVTFDLEDGRKGQEAHQLRVLR
jgi:superfamily II DNA/RNA helicase